MYGSPLLESVEYSMLSLETSGGETTSTVTASSASSSSRIPRPEATMKASPTVSTFQSWESMSTKSSKAVNKECRN